MDELFNFDCMSCGELGADGHRQAWTCVVLGTGRFVDLSSSCPFYCFYCSHLLLIVGVAADDGGLVPSGSGRKKLGRSKNGHTTSDL